MQSAVYVWYTHDTNTAILLAIELAALKFQAKINANNFQSICYCQNISSSRRQFWIPTPISRHGNDVANLPVPSQGSEPMWPQKAPNQHWRWESVWHNPNFSTRIYCILCDIMYAHLRSIPPVKNQRFYRRSNLLRIILFLRRQCRNFCETLT